MLEINICPSEVSGYRVGQLLGATMDRFLCFICEVLTVDSSGPGRLETVVHGPGGGFYVDFDFKGEAILAHDVNGNQIGIGDCEFRIVKTDFPSGANINKALFQLVEEIRQGHA